MGVFGCMGGNYNKSIIKQLEELTLDNERLSAENKSLKAENDNLWQTIKQINDSINEKIANAVEKACVPLYERISYLESENVRKDNEIIRLKGEINKDSSNSSKPPGTNGFKKVFNSREKSDKKVGGQKGHKGTTLTIPKNLDSLVGEGKVLKRVIDLTGGAKRYVSKWKVDLEIKVVYTEYRHPCKTTPSIFYGENLKSLCVLLSNNGLIAEKRLSNFFMDLTDGLIRVSVATLEKFNKEASLRVDIEGMRKDLLNDEVLNVDETVLRCGQLLEYDDIAYLTAKGCSFDVIIRTYSNANTTLYTVNPHKDDKGVLRDNILSLFCGILSHDHDKKYYKYGILHATCCAHLLRELKGLYELYGIMWANKFRNFYIDMNNYKNRTESCEVDKLSEFECKYDELLCEGDIVLGSQGDNYIYEQLRPVLSRLRKYKDSYMLFIRNYKAPFTNNQAERDLRPCKTKQKVSGCFRSWNGLVCFAIIRSFLSTMHKRKQNLFASVKELFISHQHLTAEQ
jgi:hypothetical protein